MLSPFPDSLRLSPGWYGLWFCPMCIRVLDRRSFSGASAAFRADYSSLLENLPCTCLRVFAIAVGPAVSLLLPRYLEAVPAARVVVFAGVTAGYVSLGSLGVVAAGKQRVLPVLSAILLLMNAILSYLALRLGCGILGVAVGTLLSRTLFGISILSVNAKSAALEGADASPSERRFHCSGVQPWFLLSIVGLAASTRDLPALALLAYLLLVSPLFPLPSRGCANRTVEMVRTLRSVLERGPSRRSHGKRQPLHPRSWTRLARGTFDREQVAAPVP